VDDTPGAVVDGIDAAALADYAGLCGLLLAKGHTGTSSALMIAGYVGGSDKTDRGLCRFARPYADQTERDHAALLAAADRGLLPCERGV
jgi:hypothetical protein